MSNKFIIDNELKRKLLQNAISKYRSKSASMEQKTNSVCARRRLDSMKDSSEDSITSLLKNGISNGIRSSEFAGFQSINESNLEQSSFEAPLLDRKMANQRKLKLHSNSLSKLSFKKKPGIILIYNPCIKLLRNLRGDNSFDMSFKPTASPIMRSGKKMPLPLYPSKCRKGKKLLFDNF